MMFAVLHGYLELCFQDLLFSGFWLRFLFLFVCFLTISLAFKVNSFYSKRTEGDRVPLWGRKKVSQWRNLDMIFFFFLEALGKLRKGISWDFI